MKFRAELERAGKNATGITVPAEVIDALGGGRRLAVTVTLNGYSYRSTVGVMGGVAKIPVSAAVRDAAGVAAGDILDVEVVADTAPRTVEVPGDLATALAHNTEVVITTQVVQVAPEQEPHSGRGQRRQVPRRQPGEGPLPAKQAGRAWRPVPSGRGCRARF